MKPVYYSKQQVLQSTKSLQHKQTIVEEMGRPIKPLQSCRCSFYYPDKEQDKYSGTDSSLSLAYRFLRDISVHPFAA